MPDEIETIDKNPKSWAAWKREAERLQAIIDDMVLAAMDSKPVAEVTEDLGRLFVKIHHPTTLKAGDKLYRHAQPAPVVPDGYVMVPMRLTAENGAKGALSGEFSETKFVNCPECFGDDECETCDGSGRIEITVPVTWTTIKEIWAKGVEHFAAAPQSPGSDPATVPGKWIPVSERIPDNTEPVLCIEKRADFGTYGQPFVCWHDGGGWVGKTNYRPIVTHWMPLPAAPQEVKSE